MASKNAHVLELAPFPTLTWGGYGWKGAIELPSWRGYQSRGGPYCGVDSDAPSDGRVPLHVEVPTGFLNLFGLGERPPPSPEQAATFEFLIANEQAIHAAVMQAILNDYQTMRVNYDYQGEEADELMPVVERAEQFRALIGLSAVYLPTRVSEGQTSIGFEFGCTWDEEHGFGVRTHRGRVVEVGMAEAAFGP